MERRTNNGVVNFTHSIISSSMICSPTWSPKTAVFTYHVPAVRPVVCIPFFQLITLKDELFIYFIIPVLK